MNKLPTVGGEVIAALCTSCKCCLANSGHCWTCHTTATIAKLCGCGDCDGQAKLFAETEAIRVKNRQIRYSTKGRVAA
jgi:hypothetical protein